MLKPDLPESGIDPAARLALFVERREKMEIFTNGKIFVEMFSRREKAYGRALDWGIGKWKPVEHDLPGGGSHEAGQELEECGFARPVGAQKSDHFSRRQVKANILERPE
jgi:hypothetical protein